MLSYPLLALLPADLLHYIYLINLRDKSSIQIQKFYKNRATKNNIIYEIINEFINYNQKWFNDPSRSIIKDKNIDAIIQEVNIVTMSGNLYNISKGEIYNG